MPIAHLAKTIRHINDGQQVLLQGRLGIGFRGTVQVVEAVIDVAAHGDRFLGVIGQLRSLSKMRIIFS